MNCLRVMDERMLAREVEPSSDACSYKYFAIVVVTLEGFIQLFKALRVMNIALGNVTKFQECA